MTKKRWEFFLKDPEKCNQINKCKELPYMSFYVSSPSLEENKPIGRSKIKLYKGFVIYSNASTIALYTGEGVLVLPLKEVRMKKASLESQDKAKDYAI